MQKSKLKTNFIYCKLKILLQIYLNPRIYNFTVIDFKDKSAYKWVIGYTLKMAEL